MPYKIDDVGTRTVKLKTHSLKVSKGNWAAISGANLLTSSRKFSSQQYLKKNVIALKRFFERLSYEDIEMQFRKKIL